MELLFISKINLLINSLFFLLKCIFLEYLKYAHGIVSEYLAEDLSQKLAQHLNISNETENKKRKLETSPKNTTNEKKFKRDSFEENPMPKAKSKNVLIKPEKVSYFIVITILIININL